MIRRLMWQFAYTRLCMRSGYDFTWLSAWQEACASWEMNEFAMLRQAARSTFGHAATEGEGA